MMNVRRPWVPAWQQGPLRSRKWSMSSLRPRRGGGGPGQGAPVWLSSWHTLRWSWPTWVSSFSKCTGTLGSMAFATLGHRGGPGTWEALQVLTERSLGEGNGNHTPAFLPGKSQGRRSLAGYSPWGCKESDATERLDFTLLREVERRHAGCHFESAKSPQGAQASRSPNWVMQMQMWANLWGVYCKGSVLRFRKV